LSVVSGIFVIFFSLAHPTASARFRAGPHGSISGRLCGTAAWRGRPSCPGFPLRSATGIRFSVIRRPPRSWALLTVGLPSTPSGEPGPRRGCRSARTSCGRGGCPLYSEDDGAHPGRGTCSVGACRGESFDPLQTFASTRGSQSRGISRRFRFFTGPACPSPVAPGWVESPWASPRASHPAVTGGARRGRGQVVEHGPGTTRSHQVDPRIRYFTRFVRPASHRPTQESDRAQCLLPLSQAKQSPRFVLVRSSRLCLLAFCTRLGGNAIVSGFAVSAAEAKAQWRAAPAGAEGENRALTQYQAPDNRMLLLLPRLDRGHPPPEGQFGRSSAWIGICRSSGLALRDGV
jgi:hypothetical protein